MVGKCAPYVALALLAASRPALAERVAFQAPPPPPPERGREIVTTSTIDVASLPLADLPAPFAAAATRPAELGEPAADLAIATPAELTRFRTSTSSSSFAIKVVGTGSTTAVLSTAPASRSSSLRADGWVSCERSSRAFQPLRWETLVVDASGEGAAWTVNDGWVDRSTCQATRARTTQIRLRRVAAGAGIAFAARTAEGLVVVTPAADSIVGDATMGEMRGSRGPISRVFLPIARGGASAAALSFDATRAAAWLTNAGATSTRPAAPGRVTLRLDASQTVAEATPSVLVRVAVLPSLPRHVVGHVVSQAT